MSDSSVLLPDPNKDLSSQRFPTSQNDWKQHTILPRQNPPLAFADRPADVLQDLALSIRDIHVLQLDDRRSHGSDPRTLLPARLALAREPALFDARGDECLGRFALEDLFLRPELDGPELRSDESDVCEKFGQLILRAKDKQHPRRACGVQLGK